MAEPRRFYVTETGRCYHRYANCHGLNIATLVDAPIRPARAREVKMRRLKPCKHCDPPRLGLRLVA